jgi:hypothetical protein
MKKLLLIVGLAVMAGVPLLAKQSFLDSLRASSQVVRLDGLFGVKFGDRIPSDATVIPSGDGTLMSPLDPTEPELVFQGYFAMLIPQTRVVVGLVGVDEYADNEHAKCNAAFAKCKKAIEARFEKKMKSLPPTDSGVGDSLTVLENCALELADNRFLFLQTLKGNSGGYIFRFIAMDPKAAREAVEQHQRTVKSVPPLDGLFGRSLGVKAAVSEDEETMAGGMRVQTFVPDKKFLDFTCYGLQILPQSRKVSGIFAWNDYEERYQATECFTKVCQLVERKFGLKFTDVSSNFDSTQPDEDGEQMLKCAVMSFPNSLRFVEVHCFRDVDDNVFRIRISAYDQSLLDALESENKKAKKPEQSDESALDAL